MEIINNNPKTKNNNKTMSKTCLSCLFLQRITDYQCSVKHYYACFMKKKNIDPHHDYKSCEKFQKRFERGNKK